MKPRREITHVLSELLDFWTLMEYHLRAFVNPGNHSVPLLGAFSRAQVFSESLLKKHQIQTFCQKCSQICQKRAGKIA